MAYSVRTESPSRHPIFVDNPRAVMAKARVNNGDIDWKKAVGRALSRAISINGWTAKQAAMQIGIDKAELSRWCSGTRRQQVDRILAVPELQQLFWIALAAELPGVQVSSVVWFPSVFR